MKLSRETGKPPLRLSRQSLLSFVAGGLLGAVLTGTALSGLLYGLSDDFHDLKLAVATKIDAVDQLVDQHLPNRVPSSKKILGEHTRLIDVCVSVLMDNPADTPSGDQPGIRLVNTVHRKGFKLYAIAPGSSWESIGLRNGDTLRRFDGANTIPTFAWYQQRSYHDITVTRDGTDLRLVVLVDQDC